MKVLFIHCTYRFKGGEDTVVAEELKLLRDHGVQVELLAFDNDKSGLRNLLLLPFNPFSYRRTLHTLRSFKPDVVHVHNVHFAASPSVLAAVKREKLPLVMTLHNFRLLCPSAILFFRGKPFMNSLYQRFPIDAALKGVYKNSKLLTFWISLNMRLNLWMKVWNKPDRYIVLTEHARKVFEASKLAFLVPKMVIKPNFCEVPLLPPAVRGKYFLYVGRLTEEKGVRLMMQAFARTGYEIKMAGDGPLREEVVACSTRHANIQFLGSLTKEVVFQELQQCSALVFPSVWYEGMPLTIIEAYACGTPVIASKIGAMETMIADRYNGLHFEAGNENDFLEKLNLWQSFTEQECNTYSTNARMTYEQLYTPQKNSEQLLDLYHNLVSNQPVIPKNGPVSAIGSTA